MSLHFIDMYKFMDNYHIPKARIHHKTLFISPLATTWHATFLATLFKVSWSSSSTETKQGRHASFD